VYTKKLLEDLALEARKARADGDDGTALLVLDDLVDVILGVE
jgi:hypothetical protein